MNAILASDPVSPRNPVLGMIAARLEQRFPPVRRDEANDLAITAGQVLQLTGADLVLLMLAMQGDIRKAGELATRRLGRGTWSISPSPPLKPVDAQPYEARFGDEVGRSMAAALAIIIVILKVG